MTLIYECPEAPEHRRFIAQAERLKDNLYMVVHGSTREQATAKLDLIESYRALDPSEKTGFGLKAKLDALNGGSSSGRDDDLI
jgi:hypothetical protein